MIKYLSATVAIVLLSACSSGSDTPAPTADNPGSQPGEQNPGGNNPPDGSNPPPASGEAPVGGGNPPAAGTKAGAYIGDFGAGTGVYIVNNENYLVGLALAANGSARSLYGDIGTANTFSGSLRSYAHQESVPDGAAGSFGAVASLEPATNYDLTIQNGQSISGAGVSLSGAAGQLTAANAASLAGTWQGTHGYCNADQTSCSQLTTTVTFNGVAVSGSTLITDGSPIALQGGITEFGDTALVSFIWGGNTYTGGVFFVPDGTGRLAFFGEAAGAEPPTIAGLLSAQ